MSFPNAPIELRKWLQNASTEGWQPLQSVLNDERLSQFRHTIELANSPVQRIKVLELGEQTLWLVIRLEEEEERCSIRVQLRTAEPDAILPTQVSLMLLSSAGDVVQSVAARDQDNGIQLKRFRCPMGTRFKLQISLNSDHLTEKFVV